jgi:hypothetical protein
VGIGAVVGAGANYSFAVVDTIYIEGVAIQEIGI